MAIWQNNLTQIIFSDTISSYTQVDVSEGRWYACCIGCCAAAYATAPAGFLFTWLAESCGWFRGISQEEHRD